MQQTEGSQQIEAASTLGAAYQRHEAAISVLQDVWEQRAEAAIVASPREHCEALVDALFEAGLIDGG